jgi:hypothetical protein
MSGSHFSSYSTSRLMFASVLPGARLRFVDRLKRARAGCAQRHTNLILRKAYRSVFLSLAWAVIAQCCFQFRPSLRMNMTASGPRSGIVNTRN